MALLSASLQACLEEAAAEVTRRVETNDVVRDMVAAVVTFHAEGVCDELRAALAAVERRNASLQGDIDQLQAQKGAADAELQRIKVEAEALRDALMRDVGHILYESKSLEKHHERIRELEGRVLELSQRPVAPAPAPATVSGGDEPCVAEAPSLPPSTPMTHVTRSPSPLPLLPPSLPPTLPPSLPPSTPTVASSNGAAASNGHTAPPAPPLVAPTPAPSLVALDDRAWLLVASFLTRADVVQAARANRRLFARLDVLLGMGSAVDTTGWGPPADPAEPAAAAAPALSTPAPSNSSSSSSSTSSKPKFWPFAAADAVLPASLAANVFNAVGAGIGAIGAARDRSSSGSAAKAPGNGVATTPIGVASPLPSLSLSPAPMNGGDVLSRDMADSMAKKLSCTSGDRDRLPGISPRVFISPCALHPNPPSFFTHPTPAAELRAVIGLTEMLKTKTTELEASRADNEDVVSRLQSVVTMRDFLIEKLKSAEVALKVRHI